jgi:fermentation-respiration switch protein FrsA (DUF1100 family)
VAQPTLAVHGTRDPITPVRWGEQIARLLPNARLAVLPGLTHTINFYFPLELTRIARPFLLEAEALTFRSPSKSADLAPQPCDDLRPKFMMGPASD